MRANDDVCMELSFHVVKQKCSSRKKPTLYKIIVNDLCTEISELSAIRKGSWSSSYIKENIIAAVRDIEIFEIVCRNPFKKIQELNSTLRAFALEADCERLKTYSSYNGQISCTNSPHSCSTVEEAVLDSLLVDRSLQRLFGEEYNFPTFKNSGDSPNVNDKKRNNVFKKPLKLLLRIYPLYVRKSDVIHRDFAKQAP